MSSSAEPAIVVEPAGARPAASRTAAAAFAFAVLGFALGAAALGLAWRERQTGDARLVDLEARAATLERAHGDLAQALGTATDTLNGTREDTTALRERIAGIDREIGSVKSTLAAHASEAAALERTVVLAEVEALLFTASQRLALRGDVRTALAAVDAADRRLGVGSDPALVPLREQLTRDRAALAAVPRPDVEGTALYLAEAAFRLGNLELRTFGEPPPGVAPPATGSRAGWRGLLDRIWQDLKSLVEIKDAAPPDSIAFDPGLRAFVEQNLRLELAAARLALLDHDGGNLRAATTLIVQTLDRYFDAADPDVQDLRTRLAAAAVLDLAPPLPTLDESLALVTALRATTAAGAQ